MSLPNALLWQQIYMTGIVRLLILHNNSLTSKIGMFTLVIFIALATYIELTSLGSIHWVRSFKGCFERYCHQLLWTTTEMYGSSHVVWFSDPTQAERVWRHQLIPWALAGCFFATTNHGCRKCSPWLNTKDYLSRMTQHFFVCFCFCFCFCFSLV